MNLNYLIPIFIILILIYFIVIFLIGNTEAVYTDRYGNYYRWLQTSGNMMLWRPLKKVWFLYFPKLDKDDFWLDDEEFVTMNALLLLYEEEEINYIKERIQKYDNSHPKEDEILFVKEIATKLNITKDRVCQLVQKVRRCK